MNKALLFNIFEAILFIAFRLFRILLVAGFSLLCTENLFSNINKREEWNKEYDEYVAEATHHEDW